MDNQVLEIQKKYISEEDAAILRVYVNTLLKKVDELLNLPNMVTVDYAAEKTGINKDTIYRWIKSGKIPDNSFWQPSETIIKIKPEFFSLNIKKGKSYEKTENKNTS